MKQQDWTEQLRQRLDHHEEPVPEGLWADIEQRVAPVGPARRVVLRRWMAAAAACALVVAGVWWWGDRPAPQGMSGKPEQRQVAEEIVPPSPAPPQDGRAAAAQEASIAQVQHSKGESIARHQAPAPGDDVRPDSPQPSGAETDTPSKDGVGEKEHSEGTEEQRYEDTRNIQTKQTSPPRPSAPSSTRLRARRTPELSLHATNLLADGGTTNVEPMLMAPSYMGNASQMLARSAPVYLANHDETSDHKMPLTIGLSVRLPLTGRWWLASGVDYSRVASSFTHRTSSVVQVNRQRLHYVGVPLSVGYSFWQSPRLTAYASVGGELQLNVKAQTDYGRLDRDRLQTSVLGSAGIDYRLLPQLSLYAQPGLRYYPDNGSHMQNIFKERPLQFDLQLGLRLSLR